MGANTEHHVLVGEQLDASTSFSSVGVARSHASALSRPSHATPPATSTQTTSESNSLPIVSMSRKRIAFIQSKTISRLACACSDSSCPPLAAERDGLHRYRQAARGPRRRVGPRTGATRPATRGISPSGRRASTNRPLSSVSQALPTAYARGARLSKGVAAWCWRRGRRSIAMCRR